MEQYPYPMTSDEGVDALSEHQEDAGREDVPAVIPHACDPAARALLLVDVEAGYARKHAYNEHVIQQLRRAGLQI